MVATKTYTSAKRVTYKKSSHGVHAKSKSSKLKTSKIYRKRYVGQGR